MNNHGSLFQKDGVLMMSLEIQDWVIKKVNKILKRNLSNSLCTKRAIAAVLWPRDSRFPVGGSNGPPEGFKDYCIPCPRADSGSGEDMDICPAVHGEIAALLSAARNGISTGDCILFISCALPCKDCMKEIIRAGIKYIVSPYELDFVVRPNGFALAKYYNFPLSRQMMEECEIEYVHEPRLVKGR